MSMRNTTDRPTPLRPPAVAGRFYPANPKTLRKEVREYLDAVDPAYANNTPTDSRPVRAIIAPHAGYPYSGPVAASAYARVMPMRDRINRVVLIGPSHFVGFKGIACSSAEAFGTPLGPVPVDTDTVQAMTARGDVIINDAAHAPEHGLEVHLPFLIETLGRADDPAGVGLEIIPLLFGEVDDKPVAEVLDPFLDDEQTLIVVSSDLSHYLDYGTTASVDRETADAIVASRADVITPERACGHTGVRALLRCAESRGLAVDEVDLRSSGDTAGPRDSVVGYGAFTVR